MEAEEADTQAKEQQMRKNSNAVNSSDDLIEDSYAIIDQDLADMATG